MIFFEAGVDTQGGITEFAPVSCLVTLASLSVTAHSTIHFFPSRNWLWEGSLSEASGELWIRLVVAMMMPFIAFKETLANSHPKL